MSIYSDILEKQHKQMKVKFLTFICYLLTTIIVIFILNYIIRLNLTTPVQKTESYHQEDKVAEEEIVQIKSSSRDVYILPDSEESSREQFIQSVVDVEKELEQLRLLSLENPFKDVQYQQAPTTLTSNSSFVRQAPTSDYFNSLSDSDYQMLLRIVQAEAGGINYEETLWTAHSITNRVLSTRFPNTLYEVIFANNGKGAYQFSPIANGSYFKAVPNETVIKAVNECLSNVRNGIDPTGGALFFMVPSLSSEGGRSWQENNTTLIATKGTTQFRK